MQNITGPKIKQLRNNANPTITQEQLATKLQILGWNIDRFGVSKIERGERQVLDKELILLCQALGISSQQLLGV